jgi:CRISPR-associated protein Cas2
MSGRHRILVSYDIRDPARLRRIHQIMMGFGDPLQYSVFVCELSGTERILMEEALLKAATLSEDSIALVDLGPASGVARHRIETLGRGYLPPFERYRIV